MHYHAIQLILSKVSKLFKSDNFIFSIGFLTFLPLVTISIYNNPSADDFCFNIKSNDLGFWNAQISWYQTWTGRYTSSALLSIEQLVSEPFYAYKFVPIVLILGLFFSLYTLLSLLFINLKKRDILVLITLILILYFFQMPSISQGVYWLAGSITYQVPNILSIFLMCFLIKLLQVKNLIYLLLSILCSFLIIGSNEVSMLLIDYFIFTVFIYNSIHHKKINYSLLLLVLCITAFSILVVKSPGNTLRASYFPNKNQLIYSLFKSLVGLKSYIGIWLPLIILFILIYFNDFRRKANIITSQFFNINPFIAVLFVAIIPFLGFFTGYWSVGRIPPERTINVIYFMFLIGLIYISFGFFYYLKQKKSDFIIYTKSVKFLIYTLIFILLGQNNNIRVAYSDLISGAADRYNLELNDRYSNLKHKEATLTLPPLKNKPKTIFFEDISEDPNNWSNQCISRYWGLNSVIKDKDY
ncbi:DUF6056 family protein [Mariniflexile sp. AS56]|uniref:DUF6056 family protein n=1 Tax=Mariniflexile sp. AS56 TaxID=3063957 RepID=UPI0026F2F6B5|nr:DUF6056 family protein [Mariniflexile sp. AS56]MDO7172753.1 DUF6056 family protein [Mariniflexile sp. AS56]